jgi:hypothetical protein
LFRSAEAIMTSGRRGCSTLQATGMFLDGHCTV